MERAPHFALPVDEEIVLHLPGERDAPALAALIDGDREFLRQWLPWVDYSLSVQDSLEFIQRSAEHYLANISFDMGIWYRNELAGIIGFHTFNWPNRQVEIGYWMGSRFQGRGIMTRACRAMITFAFQQLQLNRVSILCASGNSHSRAIPARLGFTEEGTIRDGEWLYDHFVDLVMYGMLAREWARIYQG